MDRNYFYIPSIEKIGVFLRPMVFFFFMQIKSIHVLY